MRLIDADVLKEDLSKFYDGIVTARELIDSQPTVELLKEKQPKKGHWIIDEYDYLDCSCCGESYYTGCDSTKEAQERLEKGQVYTYCPYCGAYMKDGEHE